MITDENVKAVIDACSAVPGEIKAELREHIPEIRNGLEAQIHYFAEKCRTVTLKLRISNEDRHPICPVRKNGNCTLLGGLCDRREEQECDTSREAYKIGYDAGYREAVQNHHEALMTLIKKRNEKADKL